MYRTIELLDALYELGLIDKEELQEEKETYSFHLNKVIEMNERLYEKRESLKHLLPIVKKPRYKNAESEEKMKRIYQLYEEGAVPDWLFKKHLNENTQ